MTKEFLKSMFDSMAKESWEERTEHFFRINNVDSKTGWALHRDIGIRPENPRGITKEDAIRMMGKSKESSLYEVTVIIKRIK